MAGVEYGALDKLPWPGVQPDAFELPPSSSSIADPSLALGMAFLLGQAQVFSMVLNNCESHRCNACQQQLIDCGKRRDG